MDLILKEKLIKYLESFVTPNRIQLINKNLNNRTRYVTLALEDIFQSHNASAVLRSCDCFGVQDIHIIENTNIYNINPKVVVGAFKWLTISRYNKQEDNTLKAINHLKNKGYRIVATTPHGNETLLHDFDLEKGKAAFFFGTELTGISDVALEHADEFVKIPMYGFTESFNISVSAALILHHIALKLRSSKLNWQLDSEERMDLKLEWLKRSVRNGDKLITRFLQKKE